jgi:serine/threonine-protein kinase
MDLLTGETLRNRLDREGALLLEQCADLLLPVVSAVGTAHERGIVHRDLKPENILLARGPYGGETVKVLDFGVAKLVTGEGPSEGSIVTLAGGTVGTPCYMAPEQATGDRDLDHRVDVWSLGVILYECLSGARPIEGETVGQVVMRLMSEGITPIERVVFDLPDDVARLVGRMLSRERRLRPESLHEVRDVLARYTAVAAPEFGEPGAVVTPVEHEPPVVSAPLPPTEMAPLRRFAWLALAALAVTGGLALLLRPGATPASEPLDSSLVTFDSTTIVASSSADPQPKVSPPPAASAAPVRPAEARAKAAPPVRDAKPARNPAGEHGAALAPSAAPAAAPRAPVPAPSAEFAGGLADEPPF